MMRALILAFFSLFTMLTPLHAELRCDTYANAKIVADDGRYLGKIGNVSDSESILNKYGNYGSKYGSSSIWNDYGHYGGQYSGLSPFNLYSRKPPQIKKNDKVIGRLTVNRSITGGVSPYFLQKCRYY
jgi:hypothetical protein